MIIQSFIPIAPLRPFIKEVWYLAGKGSGMIGVVFHPYGLRPFIHLPMKEIRNQTVEADLLIQGAHLIREDIAVSAGQLTVSDLLNKTFLAERSMQRLFDEHIGLSPAKYLNIVKVNHSLKMLSSKKKLTQIAYDSGFYDQAHFTHQFKSIVGYTPREFQQLHYTGG